jgi:hypothetical protein
MAISGGPDIVEDGLVWCLDPADNNSYAVGNGYFLNLAGDKYPEGEFYNSDNVNFIVANAGGSSGFWNYSDKTFGNNVAGTNNGYPRLLSANLLDTSNIYEISGRISGDINRVSLIRLTTGGAANYVSWNNSTGLFGSVQMQHDTYNRMDIVTNGNYTFSATIEEFNLKKINAALIRNGPTIANGVINFDGTNDYIDLGRVLDNVFAGSDNKYSISIWVKFDTLTNDIGHTLISKLGDSNHSENERQMVLTVRNLTAYNYGDYRIEFGTYGELTSTKYRFYRTSDFSVSTNEWYNIVVTYDGSIDDDSRYNIYANGSIKNKVIAFTSNSFPTSTPVGNARVSIGATIGKKMTNSPLSLFNGSMGNIAIYNKVLSASEILQNYNATKGRYGL